MKHYESERRFSSPEQAASPHGRGRRNPPGPGQHHGYIQQGAQGVEIVHRGQALAPLPLVDGLGLLKAEELLEVPDGQAFRLPQPADVGPGCGKVNESLFKIF